MNRLAIAAGLLLAAGTAYAADYQLSIIHTNDIHARMEPNNRSGSSCSPQDIERNQCYGGVARIATRIRQARTGTRNLLVLDAGDQFQGTLYYNVHKARMVAETMNLMDYDVMVVGNHEFDDGPPELARLLRGVRFPVLGSNVDASREPALQGSLQPFVIVERGGQRIGIVGVVTATTPFTSSPGPSVGFAPEEEAIRPRIAQLRALGIDKIILLSHAGLGREREIARTVDGIDIIVGGHTHTLLSNTVANAEGPYPVVERGPRGAPVLIVTSHEHGRVLGRLDVTFDARGVVKSWSGDAVLMDRDVPADPVLAAKVAELAGPIEAMRSTVIGHTDTELVGGAICRSTECSMGNLIAEAVLWHSRDKGTEIAFENGGGVRAGIPAGPITMGHVLTVKPFGNTIATFQATGDLIRRMVEHGVTQATDPQGNNTGRFLQIAGLRFTWDAAKAPGSRIVGVEVRQADGSFAPLDPQRRYKVAFNNFNRRGGDNYDMVAKEAIDPYDHGPNVDLAVSSYIAAGLNRGIAVDGRIKRLN